MPKSESRVHPEKKPKSQPWRMEGENLRIPNQRDLIGRLFLAPFLCAGLILLGIAIYGVIFLCVQGRFVALWHSLWAMLGMATLGVVLAVPCWMAVFNWSDILLDVKSRQVRALQGSWPWLKQTVEPFSNYHSVAIREEELSPGGGDSSSVTCQSVFLVSVDSKRKPFLLDRCCNYQQAQELSAAVTRVTRLRMRR